MDVLNLIYVILYFVAAVIGFHAFILHKSPLYFRLLFYAVLCCLAEEMYYYINYLCIGHDPTGFSFASFGASACYVFLFSANYGQFDSFVDDGSNLFKKARRIGLIAPFVLGAMSISVCAYYMTVDHNIFAAVLVFICEFPAFFAAYYHLKHLILPDPINFLVKPMRSCNFMCLLFITLDLVYDVAVVMDCEVFEICLDFAIPISLSAVMIAAERGRREWKI